VNTRKVNYVQWADGYDISRSLSKDKEALWLGVFRRYLGLDTGSRILDVGCGTGRFSILIARRLASFVVGLDQAPAMLARAKAKGYYGVQWLHARAESIPIPDGSFDACLVSQVIHHLEDKKLALAEMHRILRRGGRLGIRYSSHAQLATVLDYRFFPSALRIDLARLPDIHELRDLVCSAGFPAPQEVVVRQRLFDSTEDYLQKLRNRYSSVLTLIAEEEYQEGLQEAALCARGTGFEIDDQYADVTFLICTK
jgi:SAM-dependent methyltransferase